MRYKVGDKVKIREDLNCGHMYGSCRLVGEMKNLIGKTAIITAVNEHDGSYYIDIDADYYEWTDEMFDGKVAENIHIYSKGNKVIAVNEDTGKRGIARCHPDDDFNFYTGAKIALARLEESETPFGWLKEGVNYYVPRLTFTNLYDECRYDGDNFDKRNMERGIVFQTKKEAAECAKKMLAAIKSV